MRRKLQPIPLWIQWILATSLSIPLGWGFWLLRPLVESLPVVRAIVAIAIVLLTFLPLALSQWAILRRRIRHAVWWIPATAMGAILGLLGASLSLSLLGRSRFFIELGFFVSAFAGGAIVGFLQGLVLLPNSKKAYWWIVASGLGWMSSVSWLALYSMNLFFSRFDPSELAGWFILAGASGGIGGMIKGITLAWILANPRPRREG
ncbi:MAG: hypothetical protein J7647_02615 [Cyanobacteria bacterium SBLK]|nr:hypothetical protein [Cyanobacteria bacterium SBLK]